MKKCLKCEKVIEKKPSEGLPYFKTKRYCSISCSKIGQKRRTPRHCIRCGNEITDFHKKTKYCSHECYWQELREGVGVRKPYKQYTVICVECGSEFKTIPAHNQKYCSQKCSLKNTSIHLQESDYVRPINKIKRVCKTCGGEFRVWPHELKHRPCDYCSNICQIKAIGTLDETSIEKKVRHELERRGIPFVAQARVGNFFADFKIGNTIIECDGTYWHSLPENVERDGRKNNYYGKHGYAVYRFTDKEINADVRGCVDIVEKAYSEDMSVACR